MVKPVRKHEQIDGIQQTWQIRLSEWWMTGIHIRLHSKDINYPPPVEGNRHRNSFEGGRESCGAKKNRTVEQPNSKNRLKWKNLPNDDNVYAKRWSHFPRRMWKNGKKKCPTSQDMEDKGWIRMSSQRRIIKRQRRLKGWKWKSLSRVWLFVIPWTWQESRSG